LDVLREMIRVARKGGVVAAQEPDMLFQCSYPDSPAYRRLGDMFATLFPDAAVGRKLPSLFSALGYRPSGTVGGIGTILDPDGKRLYRLTVEGMGAALLRAGFCSELELQAMLQEFVRIEQDDSVFCVGHPLIAAWIVVS
jgi:hypothetical protein